MPNVDSLTQTISQSLANAPQETVYFSAPHLQYAQSKLH